MRQGDVLLQHTPDGGEITVVGGEALLDAGFKTAAYLSLFGGNEGDTTWWGNLLETDSVLKYAGRFSKLLGGIPATSGNIRRLEEAAQADLAWFIDERVASKVDVVASLVAPNRVQLDISVEARGSEERFAFTSNWKATAA